MRTGGKGAKTRSSLITTCPATADHALERYGVVRHRDKNGERRDEGSKGVRPRRRLGRTCVRAREIQSGCRGNRMIHQSDPNLTTWLDRLLISSRMTFFVVDFVFLIRNAYILSINYLQLISHVKSE